MPAGYAKGQFRESAADPGRNADLPALSPRPDRDHSAKGHGSPRRCRHAGFIWDGGADEIASRPLALFRKHSSNGNVSPILSAAKPSAHGKKEGMGRYVAGARTPRGANISEAA